MRRIVLLILSIVTLVFISNVKVYAEMADGEIKMLLKAYEKMSKIADKLAQDVIEMEEVLAEEATGDVEERDLDNSLSL